MDTNIPSPCTMDLVNGVTEALSTIRILSGLGPLIDGSPEHFETCIELLALINQHIGHADRLVDQLAHCILPRPVRLEDMP